MRTGIMVEVSGADRRQLAAITADRNSPQQHVWRAQIVLLTAQGCGTAEIMRRADASKTTVWRWQERYMTDGVGGLLRDKTRPSRISPLTAEVGVGRCIADPGQAARRDDALDRGRDGQGERHQRQFGVPSDLAPTERSALFLCAAGHDDASTRRAMWLL